MTWSYKSFEELDGREMYELLKLRSLVFVVEQNCVFLDIDDKDQKSFHLLGYEGDTMLAYSRIVPAGVSYKEISIGRVVTHPLYRRKGLGKALMETSIAFIENHLGSQAIRIGAQVYLKSFYESFGFNTISEVYIEDGIPHVEMLRS